MPSFLYNEAKVTWAKGAQVMNISVALKNGLLPDKYGKYAPVEDTIDGHPCVSFPIDVSEVPEGTPVSYTHLTEAALLRLSFGLLFDLLLALFFLLVSGRGLGLVGLLEKPLLGFGCSGISLGDVFSLDFSGLSFARLFLACSTGGRSLRSLCL